MPSSPDPLDDLAAHPDLLLELEAADAAGISWRRWCGWEPARVTTHEYDDSGRLIRSVTTVEPEWDDDSRAAVVALMRYRAGLCPGCRNPLSETADPASEGQYVRPAGPPTRCYYCEMLAIYQQADKDERHPSALLYSLHRRPPEQEEGGDG